MDSFFSIFHKIVTVGVVSWGSVVSSVLPHHSHPIQTIQQHLLPTPTVAVVQKQISIQKTINTAGKSVTIFLTMPVNGGEINGVVSGDCQGAIDGTYAGQPTYTFNGKGEITCNIGPFSLPATASFTGLVHPTQQSADIHYSVSSGSNFSKLGDITVPYTEK